MSVDLLQAITMILLGLAIIFNTVTLGRLLRRVRELEASARTHVIIAQRDAR